jgi:hypothetical protein
MVIMGKFGNFFNVSASLGEPCKDCSNISTLLHGYDAQLIFLINPN